jgi:hypothetical protein
MKLSKERLKEILSEEVQKFKNKKRTNRLMETIQKRLESDKKSEDDNELESSKEIE